MRLPMPHTFTFADISDNTKYAYATGFATGDDDIYSAFSVATYFENKLVEIPIFSHAASDWLFGQTNIVDSLSFLGMSSHDEY